MRGALRGPWRRPWILATVAWGYVAWFLAPLALAIRTSFTAGDDIGAPQGFSLGWYYLVVHDPGLRGPFLASIRLAILTTLIATPLGAAAALGLHRWRGLASSITGGVLLVGLATPQVVLAVALFLVFGFLYDLRLDGRAVLAGHVTLALPFVVLIVRSRLLATGTAYEEMAMDLGASPFESIRRVTVPLLVPALVVAAVVAFALSFDNFALTNWLCLFNECRTTPTFLYDSGRGGDPSPAALALGSLALGVSVLAVALALVVPRGLRAPFRLRALGTPERAGRGRAGSSTPP